MAAATISDSRLARLVRDGLAAQRAGDVARATALLHDALRLDPAQPAVLNALGMLALRSGDDTAATWFARACAADPSAGPLWLNLAAAHRQSGNDAAERAALEGALAADQRDIMANLRFAELLDRLGEPKAAFARWQGLFVMLSGMSDRPRELDPLLESARSRVTEHTRDLGAAIDASLLPLRDEIDFKARRRFEAGVDAMLGRRRIFANACHGMHFPFLPADEFFDPDLFAWLPELESHTPAIVAELKALLESADPGFAPYVALDPGSPQNRWTQLDGNDQWSARYLWRYGVRDEAVCAHCPVTAAALEAVPKVDLPGQAPNAFFSILKPGTRLPAHTGVSNVRAIVHLPLIVPERCGFRVGGETREWRVGSALAFDDTIEHEAWNDSDFVRAVLILDVWNPHLSEAEQAMLRALFATLQNDASSLSAAFD